MSANDEWLGAEFVLHEDASGVWHACLVSGAGRKVTGSGPNPLLLLDRLARELAAVIGGPPPEGGDA